MMKVQTILLREPVDVDRRLAEMDLDRNKLLQVRDIACASAANATAFHRSNAAGTFAYQEGSWALRDQNVGDHWDLDRSCLEGITNHGRRIRVAYSNVDKACDDGRPPKPRTPKGPGSEIACQGNLFGESLPEFVPDIQERLATYYLMVDENGAVELSKPAIKDRTFSAFFERIFLSDGSDMDTEIHSLDDGDIADDFDPQIARK